MVAQRVNLSWNGRLLFLKVKINGYRFEFLIDTCSTRTVIGMDMAKKLSLNVTPGTHTSTAMNGCQFNSEGTANLEIVTDENVKFSARALVRPGKESPVIGLDILGKHTSVIYPDDVSPYLLLNPPGQSECRSYLDVYCIFEDSHTIALVDTGCPGCYVSDSLVNTLHIPEIPCNITEKGLPGGSNLVIKNYVHGKISLPRLPPTIGEYGIIEQGPLENYPPKIIIGMDALRHYIINITKESVFLVRRPFFVPSSNKTENKYSNPSGGGETLIRQQKIGDNRAPKLKAEPRRLYRYIRYHPYDTSITVY